MIVPSISTASNAVSTEFESEGRWTPPFFYMYLKTETSDVSLRYYVYVLYSVKDGGFYIGFTTNLRKRLTQHSKGSVTSTKQRLPIILIHYEYFINKKDAKSKEVFLKSGFGRRQLKQSVKQTLKELSK